MPLHTDGHHQLPQLQTSSNWWRPCGVRRAQRPPFRTTGFGQARIIPTPRTSFSQAQTTTIAPQAQGPARGSSPRPLPLHLASPRDSKPSPPPAPRHRLVRSLPATTRDEGRHRGLRKYHVCENTLHIARSKQPWAREQRVPKSVTCVTTFTCPKTSRA